MTDAVPACLHLVMSSHLSLLSRCLTLVKAGDRVVFLAEGAFLPFDPNFDAACGAGCVVSVLGPDARARGIHVEKYPAGIAVIEDRELVDLVKQCPHSLSWH